MKDEQHDVWQFRDARSFFRDSWSEVPDESTKSRIMRPRTVAKGRATDADEPKKAGRRDMMEEIEEMMKRMRKKEEKEGKGSQKRKTKIFAVSATYVSTQDMRNMSYC